MKDSCKGSTIKPIPGVVTNPKKVSEQGTVQNAGSGSKPASLQNIAGSHMPPPKG